MKKINKNQFITLYDKGLNDVEIGKTMGLTPSCIAYNRKILKLPSNFKYKNSISKEEFLQFRKENKTDNEIIDIIEKRGGKKSSVLYVRSKEKLLPKKHKSIILSEEEKQIILGSTLGDASILRTGKENSSNCYFKFTHGKKQKEYAMWKQNYIERLVSKSSDRVQIDKRTNNENITFQVCTYSNPVFNQYREMFYKENKQVSKEVLNLLKPLGIAVWYQDDGCYSNGKIYIATCGFDNSSLENIKNWFFEKYNIKVTIHKSKSIYIWKKDNCKFFNIVKNFICPILKYKCPE